MSLSVASYTTDLAAVLHEEAFATAAALGLPAGGDLAASIVDRVMLRLGGREVYVPKRAGRTQTALAHARIRARFTGTNQAELAREAGMSARQIRRILQDRPTK